MAHGLRASPEKPDAIWIDDSEAIRLPKISIHTLAASGRGSRESRVLSDEITAGLSSFRAFDLYQAEYFDDQDGYQVSRVEHDELGSFLLRCRRDDAKNTVYIQFENRATGQILFNDIVDFDLVRGEGGAREAAVQTVTRVRNLVISRLLKPGAQTPFAKWCQAEALLWEFSSASDQKALKILEEIQKTQNSFSMAYAGKASIQLKQVIYYPYDVLALPRPEEIVLNAERAVALDPWQTINQRIHAWALMTASEPDDALRSFKRAAHLGPLDASNILSVAEGLGFLGEIELAKSYARKAYNLLQAVPRVFYEYLANVYFSASEFDDAADFLQKAPISSVFGLTTRVAALICAGRISEAEHAVEMVKEGTAITRQIDIHGVVHELQAVESRAELFKDPGTRVNFLKGTDFIKSRVS
ncbi:tetratricopeptide repeat protein [Roseibium sp. RKSG952]|uniref:tetratricopeptide repeat protein n=1 Tax=Roseibium sp. RKSG952 TaxID=2529384 RepID=UPI001FCBB9D4|nr:hypothetical protein [Roseibium sp. RKSG952]